MSEAKKKAAEIKKITGNMSVSFEDMDIIYELRGMRSDIGMSCLDIFNYGYILGKREERARRKAHRSA